MKNCPKKSSEKLPKSPLKNLLMFFIQRQIFSDANLHFAAAGIPDFRSPGTGLYDNLQKYNLPSPQAIFDISFFRVSSIKIYVIIDKSAVNMSMQ